MQVWYADHLAVCEYLTHLRTWLDNLAEMGPKYGYQQNALDIWPIAKEDKIEHADTGFKGLGTRVNSTLEGKTHVGAAVGSGVSTGGCSGVQAPPSHHLIIIIIQQHNIL